MTAQISDDTFVTLQLPTRVFAELQALHDADSSDPVSIVTKLIRDAHQQQAWQQTIALLRQQIIESGGLALPESDDDVVQQLRSTRRTPFADDYAHLY